MSAETGQNRTLPPRRRLAVEALATGADQATAALTCGVTARTVRRWQAMPDFVAALREAQDAALAQTTRRLASGATAMLDVLEEVAGDAAMPPAVRVRGALGWLGAMRQAVELEDLVERVARLEANTG